MMDVHPPSMPHAMEKRMISASELDYFPPSASEFHYAMQQMASFEFVRPDVDDHKIDFRNKLRSANSLKSAGLPVVYDEFNPFVETLKNENLTHGRFIKQYPLNPTFRTNENISTLHHPLSHSREFFRNKPSKPMSPNDELSSKSFVLNHDLSSEGKKNTEIHPNHNFHVHAMNRFILYLSNILGITIHPRYSRTIERWSENRIRHGLNRFPSMTMEKSKQLEKQGIIPQRLFDKIPRATLTVEDFKATASTLNARPVTGLGGRLLHNSSKVDVEARNLKCAKERISKSAHSFSTSSYLSSLNSNYETKVAVSQTPANSKLMRNHLIGGFSGSTGHFETLDQRNRHICTDGEILNFPVCQNRPSSAGRICGGGGELIGISRIRPGSVESSRRQNAVLREDEHRLKTSLRARALLRAIASENEKEIEGVLECLFLLFTQESYGNNFDEDVEQEIIEDQNNYQSTEDRVNWPGALKDAGIVDDDEEADCFESQQQNVLMNQTSETSFHNHLKENESLIKFDSTLHKGLKHISWGLTPKYLSKLSTYKNTHGNSSIKKIVSESASPFASLQAAKKESNSIAERPVTSSMLNNLNKTSKSLLGNDAVNNGQHEDFKMVTIHSRANSGTSSGGHGNKTFEGMSNILNSKLESSGFAFPPQLLKNSLSASCKLISGNNTPDNFLSRNNALRIPESDSNPLSIISNNINKENFNSSFHSLSALSKDRESGTNCKAMSTKINNSLTVRNANQTGTSMSKPSLFLNKSKPGRDLNSSSKHSEYQAILSKSHSTRMFGTQGNTQKVDISLAIPNFPIHHQSKNGSDLNFGAASAQEIDGHQGMPISGAVTPFASNSQAPSLHGRSTLSNNNKPAGESISSILPGTVSSISLSSETVKNLNQNSSRAKPVKGSGVILRKTASYQEFFRDPLINGVEGRYV